MYFVFLIMCFFVLVVVGGEPDTLVTCDRKVVKQISAPIIYNFMMVLWFHQIKHEQTVFFFNRFPHILTQWFDLSNMGFDSSIYEAEDL